MKKIASNELKAFLQDWLNWAEGRESNITYRKGGGLCSNSHLYDSSLMIQNELHRIFNNSHPFGYGNYYHRLSNGTQHQDPNRLAWVRAALNDTLDTWELVE